MRGSLGARLNTENRAFVPPTSAAKITDFDPISSPCAHSAADCAIAGRAHFLWLRLYLRFAKLVAEHKYVGISQNDNAVNINRFVYNANLMTLREQFKPTALQQSRYGMLRLQRHKPRQRDK